jgi:hypothetical protein
MDRTVPRTGSDEVELYIRTYYSLLRTTDDVKIQSLEEVHAGIGSALHAQARSSKPDFPAMIYSTLRLPACIVDVQRVVLGQSRDVFVQEGIGDIEAWRPAAAEARRRRCFTDDQGTLACYIASRSDIDDMVPVLTAFQVEWNKFHRLLQGDQVGKFLQDPGETEDRLAVLAHGIGVDVDDLARLQEIWGGDFWHRMRLMARRQKRMRIRLLSGSFVDYQRATSNWWKQIERAFPPVALRPVYFVSSNTHSLANLITGFALRHERELLEFLRRPAHGELLAEWRDIEDRQVPSSRENFLYYILKEHMESAEGGEIQAAYREAERGCGVTRIPAEHGFDLEAQVIELSQVNLECMDPRLRREDIRNLRQSEALILNIDYPLGMLAYQILSHAAAQVGKMEGVYLLGKAATLNGVIGDVMVPSVVHDEHSQNTYLFDNCFSAADIGDNLVYGTVLDNQKAVTVPGTFLQTPRYMDVFYREGYTDIEMESGPYLSAVYEMYRPKRHPNNEIVNLYEIPFDLGILHYASDTPLSKGLNLGAMSLSYYGMDPTYATSVAILRRIFEMELRRLAEGRG